jgi:hypothetical protein
MAWRKILRTVSFRILVGARNLRGFGVPPGAVGRSALLCFVFDFCFGDAARDFLVWLLGRGCVFRPP